MLFHFHHKENWELNLGAVNMGQKAARLKNHPDDVLFTSGLARVLSTKCLLTADSQQGQLRLKQS